MAQAAKRRATWLTASSGRRCSILGRLQVSVTVFSSAMGVCATRVFEGLADLLLFLRGEACQKLGQLAAGERCAYGLFQGPGAVGHFGGNFLFSRTAKS
jgi:hypothetical protein